MSMLKSKHCPRCGEDKPLEMFTNKASAPDGKYHICADCKNEEQRNRRKNKITKSNSPDFNNTINVNGVEVKVVDVYNLFKSAGFGNEYAKNIVDRVKTRVSKSRKSDEPGYGSLRGEYAQLGEQMRYDLDLARMLHGDLPGDVILALALHEYVHSSTIQNRVVLNRRREIQEAELEETNRRIAQLK